MKTCRTLIEPQLAKTFFVCIVFLAPGLAFAFCSIPNPPRVCNEFFKASGVFVGTVATVTERIGQDDSIDGWVFKLDVKQNYRGIDKSSVEVFTANNSGRFPLEKDRTYLLFPEKHDGIFEIYGCGNGAELPEAEPAIRQIDNLIRDESKASGEDIGGQIDAIPGITVIAKDAKGSFQTVTDQHGRFHLHVPAGRYSVETKSSDWVVSPIDISYQRPEHIEIHNGGCADLAMHAVQLNSGP